MVSKQINNECTRGLCKKIEKLNTINKYIKEDSDKESISLIIEFQHIIIKNYLLITKLIKQIGIESINESMYLYREYYDSLDHQTSKHNSSIDSDKYYKDENGNIKKE